jgi:two-component system alkaline phosphatase synthesis response regulator PhoP
MKTVLLVEDDKFLSSLLKNRLEKEGVNLLYAPDGEAALQVLRSQPVGLVLLDIILPKKSGFEVLQEMQSDPLLSKIKVIIASNLGQDADIIRGKELGAMDYYVKAQTSIDDLVSKVKATLETIAE